MGALELRRMSVDEYIALDRTAEERWSYVNGEAWAMAGASVEHNLVARNILFALMKALEGRTCRALSEGQKIATPRTRAFHYADASVVCGHMLLDTTDDHAITNPVVIVEVLSPTTADYDRGGKFAHYRTIASFREYVIVDADARRVEHHQRLETGQWLMTELPSDSALELPAIEVTIPLTELWVDLDPLAERADA